MTDGERKKGFWKNAFDVEKAAEFQPSEEERIMLDRVAGKIVGLGMALPSILFLESARPLNFVGAQTLAFFEPIVRTVFSQWETYSRFYKMLERRGSIEWLIDRIEHFESMSRNPPRPDKKKDDSSKNPN